MYSTRLVQILMLALSIMIATKASWLHHDVGARQLSLTLPDGDDSNAAAETSPAATPDDSDDPTPTSSESSDAETTTSSDPPTTTTDEPTTSDPPTTTTPPSTSEPTPTPTPTDSDSDSDSSTITTPPTTNPSSTPTPTPTGGGGGGDEGSDSGSSTTQNSTPSTTPKPTTKTTTVFYTTTDGSGSTHVGSSESLVVTTPSFSGDNSGSSGGQDDGITPMVRDTIIGVTVGVGGAIILAAGGILYWRLRNKRRNQDESEELISYGAGFGGPGTAEKTEGTAPAAGARSPFQSTLETYHAPTQTNAASNF